MNTDPDRQSATRCFRDHVLKADVVALMPGYFYVTKQLEYISTVLGTCIAVCLYDTRKCFGGMNHFLLPKADRLRPDHYASMFRYGDLAMTGLLERMQLNGSELGNLEAYVCGGARVNGDRFRIGPANHACALAFLQGAGIPVLAEDVGGDQARQLLFDPHSGRMRVRKIALQCVPDAAEKEAAMMRDALSISSLQANMPGRK